jgi:NAD(P)-dependent dehydrogenase (short-subunit alcohol dehydrogenase family)
MASDPTSPTYARDRPNGDAYRSSKSALNFIIIQEAIQSASTALKVFAFCPGLVESALRGPSEEARTALGNAKDPATSGEGILRIIQGKRDTDAGKLVHAGNFVSGGEGVYPW